MFQPLMVVALNSPDRRSPQKASSNADGVLTLLKCAHAMTAFHLGNSAARGGGSALAEPDGEKVRE